MRNRKFYKLELDTGESFVDLMCLTYKYGTHYRYIGVEYYILSSSGDNGSVIIPNHRQATFKEELRVSGQAASVFEGKRAEEVDHIKAKLLEAYGNIIQIEILEIRPREISVREANETPNARLGEINEEDV